MNNVAVFQAEITDVTPKVDNPLFSTCTIKVMYTGLNRNKSFIAQEVVDAALPTLYGIPIVGEYKETIEDFGGHGGKIEISDEGMKFIKTTVPYGFVPESATTRWETIDGKDWLFVEGAVLWTGRYEEANKVVEDGKGQSMEVEFTKGTFGSDKVFNVDEMIFSALCILGDEKDPCFEGASIGGEQTFSYQNLDTEKFRAEFSLMTEELKASMKGDVSVSDNTIDTPVSADFTFTSEQLENELRRLLRTQTYVDRWGWESNKFWFVDYTMDTNIVIAESNESGYLVGMDFSVTGDLVDINFDSARRFKVEFVEMALSNDPDGDGDNDIIDGDMGFSLMTADKQEYLDRVKQAQFEAEQAENSPEGNFENGENQEGEVAPEGEVPAENFENTEDETVTETPETPVAPVAQEFQAEYDSMKAELERLRKFEADTKQAEKDAQVNALLEKFTAKGQLTEEEVADLRIVSATMTYEAFEDKVFALMGRKVAEAQFSLADNNPVVDNSNGNRMAVFTDDVPYPQSDKPYAHLIYKTVGRGRK